MRETWVQSLGWEDPLEKGVGKGYPLQYSGLENSMDYTVHGSQSQTGLCDFFTYHPTRNPEEGGDPGTPLKSQS